MWVRDACWPGGHSSRFLPKDEQTPGCPCPRTFFYLSTSQAGTFLLATVLFLGSTNPPSLLGTRYQGAELCSDPATVISADGQRWVLHAQVCDFLPLLFILCLNNSHLVSWLGFLVFPPCPVLETRWLQQPWNSRQLMFLRYGGGSPYF